MTAAATAGLLADLALPSQSGASTGEVTSVNGQTGAVVLNAADVEAIAEAAAGAPNGVATLNASGELPETQLPSAMVRGNHYPADGEGNVALGTTLPNLSAPPPPVTEFEKPQGNTAFGVNALSALTSGWMNTAVGWGAAAALTSSEGCTAIGYRALYTQTGGFGEKEVGQAGNVAVGQRSMEKNVTGHYNTAVGTESLTYNSTGFQNTALGFNAMERNETGNLNTAVGENSLQRAKTGSNNTGVGVNALRYNNGEGNVAVGLEALEKCATGKNNVAVGAGALVALTTGAENVAVGHGAGKEAKTNSGCVFLGYGAGGQEAESSRLYIHNSNSSEPLIWGQFHLRELRFYTEKLALYKGVAPVARQPTIADPAEELKSVKEKLEQVIAAIKAIGIIE